VRWIDWKTSRISHYTRDKKREIECLRELKKAIVNEAVTKGGEDWETKSLRHLLQRATVKNRPEMPLLSVVRERGVIPRQLDKSENHNVIPGDLSGNLLLRKGQFVINKMKAWQGSCAVSELDGIVSPAYFVFDLRFENKTFFHYAIRSGYYTAKFAQVSKGIRSGQWDLPVQELNSIQFMYPPPDEQTRIVAYLDDQCAAIDAVTAKLMREIELLDEYKMSMISDAVTGKIDLRNVEIPDFEPEDEPINESEEGIENDDD
jgi:type I restriction enzyme S subunit